MSDKISSAKKTCVGPAKAELSELELKIQIIKGREIFERITAGINTSIESTLSPLDDIDIWSSPIPREMIIQHPRQRSLPNDDESNSHKKAMFENES